MGVRPPQKPTPPKKTNPPHPQIPAPHLQFILSLSKDELGVPPKKPPTQSQNPPTQPLDNPKPTFYNNPNAKTSFPQTAPNGGNNGVKSRPG